jgi:polyhydroxyalkanoate synthesis regulator phasin
MKMSKTMIAGAVTAAALAIGGGAVAATQFGSDDDEQAILNDAAVRLGVEPEELSAALEDAIAARIDAAVAAGELTQEQADRIKERLEQGGLPLFGPGFGPDGPMGMHVRHGLDAAATYLGLSEEELRESLRSGETLAEIATELDKTVEGLTQAMVDAATADLEQAVADGRLTEEQKQEILEDLPERIAAIVQGELPPRGPGRGWPGEDGGPPEGEPETETT